MPYSAYIFDMDGTLVNNMGFHIKIWTEFLASIGSPVDEETFFHRTVGKINTEILREFVRADLTDAQVADYSLRKEELYRKRFRPLLIEIPGLSEFLRKVSAAGMPVALATSAGMDNVVFVLEGLGIAQYFCQVVSADEVINGKPHPEIFLKAAGKLGVSAANCLVFEDSPSGLQAAYRAGMQSVALTTTFPEERLCGEPGIIRIVRDYTGLEMI
jgi:beta-phosphoglucomutase